MERERTGAEDLAPEHPELETANDEFLDDLNEKVGRPFTREELRARRRATAERGALGPDRRPDVVESTDATLEKLNLTAETAERNVRWNRLSGEQKAAFGETRKLYALIGQEILRKRGDDLLVSLSQQAREAYEELWQAYGAFLQGEATAKAFIEVLEMTSQQLEQIEHRLSSHP